MEYAYATTLVNSIEADYGSHFHDFRPEDVDSLSEDLIAMALKPDAVDPVEQDAVNNLQLAALRDSLVERIRDSDLPEGVKQELVAQIMAAFNGAMVPNVDPAVELAVADRHGAAVGEATDDFWALMDETLQQLHEEEVQKQVNESPEAGEGGAESGVGAAGGGGGAAAGGAGGVGGGAPNWLVALARAMAQVQTQWADRMQAASDTMVSTTQADDKAGFIQAQAEFAAYARLFSMASEQTSTAIKSIGDGLTSVARKQ